MKIKKIKNITINNNTKIKYTRCMFYSDSIRCPSEGRDECYMHV